MTKSQQLEALQTRVTETLAMLEKYHAQGKQYLVEITGIQGANYAAGYGCLDGIVGHAILDLRRALEDSQ